MNDIVMFEYVVQGLDGEVCFFDVWKFVLCDDEGKLIVIFGMVWEIIEWCWFVNELCQCENVYWLLVDNLFDSLICVICDG